MKTKRFIVAAMAALLALGANAQDGATHFKWYGFIRRPAAFRRHQHIRRGVINVVGQDVVDAVVADDAARAAA